MPVVARELKGSLNLSHWQEHAVILLDQGDTEVKTYCKLVHSLVVHGFWILPAATSFTLNIWQKLWQHGKFQFLWMKCSGRKHALKSSGKSKVCARWQFCWAEIYYVQVINFENENLKIIISYNYTHSQNVFDAFLSHRTLKFLCLVPSMLLSLEKKNPQ